MNLSANSRALLERMRPTIENASPDEIARAVNANELSSWRDGPLALAHDGSFRAFFAPLDWINDAADIIIVGVTPGKQQALEALLTFRNTLKEGCSIEDAARRAKAAASFKGGMRTLGARLMDHFGLHKVFGLETTLDLFGRAAARAHYTSALRYPVIKKFQNYSGDRRVAKLPFMKRMIETHLAEEIAALPKAWIVPFGPTALLALEHLANSRLLDPDRILGGILHPGGQQWNRYNVQLGLVDRAAALKVSGGAEVLRRSDALREKVQNLTAGNVAAIQSAAQA